MTLFDEIRSAAADRYFVHVGNIVRVEGRSRQGPFGFYGKLTGIQVVHYELNRCVGRELLR